MPLGSPRRPRRQAVALLGPTGSGKSTLLQVAIIPRLFIGVTAYFAYAGLKRFNEILAIGVGAAVGTATNTILVLGMAVVRGYMDIGLAATIAVTHGIPEIIVAVVISVAVVATWRQIALR
ncbi:MAG: hypothetical protein DRI79_14645, partial [Chloroflexi bacterium]